MKISHDKKMIRGDAGVWFVHVRWLYYFWSYMAIESHEITKLWDFELVHVSDPSLDGL